MTLVRPLTLRLSTGKREKQNFLLAFVTIQQWEYTRHSGSAHIIEETFHIGTMHEIYGVLNSRIRMILIIPRNDEYGLSVDAIILVKMSKICHGATIQLNPKPTARPGKGSRHAELNFPAATALPPMNKTAKTNTEKNTASSASKSSKNILAPFPFIRISIR